MKLFDFKYLLFLLIVITVPIVQIIAQKNNLFDNLIKERKTVKRSILNDKGENISNDKQDEYLNDLFYHLNTNEVRQAEKTNIEIQKKNIFSDSPETMYSPIYGPMQEKIEEICEEEIEKSCKDLQCENFDPHICHEEISKRAYENVGKFFDLNQHKNEKENNATRPCYETAAHILQCKDDFKEICNNTINEETTKKVCGYYGAEEATPFCVEQVLNNIK
ncbi:hypothetical protein GVAV_002822 [Gurleya vavrai]